MAATDEAVLKAVTNARRREILRLVWKGERASGEIASHFDVSWPAISQNLRVLEDAELVHVRRSGTTRYYRANHARLRPLRKLLETMWRDDLDRLASLAEREAKASSKTRKRGTT